MEEEKKKEDEKKEYKFKLLNTMLPSEVFDELKELAMNEGGFRGWDYGSVIRELLWCRKVFFNTNIRLDDLDVQVKELRERVMSIDVTQSVPVPEQKVNNNPDGLLGNKFKKKGE